MNDTPHASIPISSSTAIGAAWWRRRDRGAIAIMTALLLSVIIGFIALALELAQIYNRNAELQAVAEGAAISAARKLDGSSQGISDAVAAATSLVASGSKDAKKLHYQYKNSMTFLDAALKFGTSPDGDVNWMSSSAAKALPDRIAYVKVDTNELDTNYGKVSLFLIRVLATLPSLQLSHTAVAGRQRTKLMPLAICAMSKNAAQPFQARLNSNGNAELTEYGFRRGVSYNLMKLSPNTATPVNYLVDPVSLPPKGGNYATGVVGPYVCTGSMEFSGVVDRTLNLQSPFPLAQFINHLNSRFNSFNATNKECSAMSAPPDTNIRSFAYGGTNINWMSNPGRQAADPLAGTDRLETVADADPSNPAAATSYGPLWVFARPVLWSSYQAGQAEPAQGYTPFQATAAIWKSLYPPGPNLTSYPTDAKTSLQSPPYFVTQSAGTPSTNYPGLMYRRVLNVPLLSCPAINSPGKVVSIGRFFMTAPADANGIYAEFAGVTLKEEVSGPVELFR